MVAEPRKCKNRKCKRILPDGYKHKYCEHCMTVRADRIKKNGKKVLNVALVLGGAAVAIAQKGDINLGERK